MVAQVEQFIWWKGVVEDRMDPLFLGRCRVRIFGHHPKFIKPTAEDAEDDPSSNYLPIDELPWALPVQPITSAAMTGIGHAPVGPVEGTWVFGFFMDGDDCQLPVIVGTIGGIEMKKNDDTPGIQTSGDGTPPSEDSPATPETPEQVDTPTTVAEETGGVLGPLSQADLDKLKETIGMKESTSNYGAVNQLGYIGKYQFGNAALHDIGYTKSTSYNNGVLDTDANWTGKNGASSKAAFLASPSAQEAAMDANLKKNYSTLLSKGTITKSSSKEEVAGYLTAAHLVGAGGANQLKNGNNSSDANGTKASSYYAMGAGAVGKSGPPPTPSSGSSSPKPNFPDTPQTPHTDPASFDDAMGFKDPNKIYPKMDDLDKRPDTNFLAYDDHINKTNVKLKEDGRTEQVPVALDADKPWDQPKPPYNAEYPFNHVYESESGHVLEFDDTKENERISMWHKKGTFYEIDVNGTMVTKIVGDGYWILDRNGYVTVGGRVNITVEGDVNLYAKNDVNLQVDGKVAGKVYNDMKLEVSGKMDLAVKEGLHIRAKSVHFETEEQDGEAFTVKNKSDGAIRFESIGDMDFFAEKDFNVFSNKKLSLRATGKEVAIDGAKLSLQQNRAKNKAHLVDKSLPGDEELFEPEEKKDPSPPEFTELTVPTHSDKAAFFYDEPGFPPEEVDAYIQKQVDNGNYKQEDLDKAADEPLGPVDETPPPPDAKKPEACPDGFELAETYSPALQLSPSYTLGAVSSGAVVTHSAVVAQRGLKKGEIVCNLRSLCLTSLEPIKAQYPNMFVTSGFRTGSGTSQHEVGQAADLQFQGLSKKDYFAVAQWIRDNVSFDQLILEYKTTGTGMPWIHVSCNQKGNRKQVLTMMNHKVIGGSLINQG